MKNTNNYFVTEYKFPPVEAVKKGQKNLKNTLKKNSKKFGKLIQFIFSKK